jgi:glycosyltransferase involved in cell wall biosynthesis
VRALILDPGLRSAGGHHLNAAVRLSAELAKLEVESACFGSAYAEPAVVEATGCLPCFSRSVYGRRYDSPTEFASGAEQMEAEFVAALAPRGIAVDLLLLPCADQMLVQAVARLFRRQRFRQPTQLLLWLLYPPHFRRPGEPQPVSAVDEECRTAFGQLIQAIGKSRLRVFCETAALADYYGNLLSLEVGVMPGANPDRAALICSPDRPTTGTTIVCLGYANRAKGYGLLPQAIAAVLERRRDVRFLIHGVSQGSDAEDQAVLFEQLRVLGARVSIRQDVLSRADYEGWLARADFLLLPYDPEVYRTRGSGIFSEAEQLGIPVIAPAACAFARPAFDGGWGSPIEQYDAEGVASAIAAALDHRSALTERARAAAGACRDRLPRLLEEMVAAAAAERRSQRAPWLRRIATTMLHGAARYLPPGKGPLPR